MKNYNLKDKEYMRHDIKVVIIYPDISSDSEKIKGEVHEILVCSLYEQFTSYTKSRERDLNVL